MSEFKYLKEENYIPERYDNKLQKETAYQLKRIADMMEASVNEARQ